MRLRQLPWELATTLHKAKMSAVVCTDTLVTRPHNLKSNRLNA